MNKYRSLANILEQYSSKPAQGSKEWKDFRKNIIGGSEIYHFRSGKYRSLKSLAKSKLDIVQFNGNIHTRWGQIFENISRIILEELLTTHIEEIGYMPYLYSKSGQLIGAYSPDGLMVIPRHKLIGLDFLDALYGKYTGRWQDLMLDLEDLFILCEFKNPSKRIPGETIPDNYRYQIWSGLKAFPLCDLGLYMDSRVVVADPNPDNAISGFIVVVSSQVESPVVAKIKRISATYLSYLTWNELDELFRLYLDGSLMLYFHHKIYIHDEVADIPEDLKQYRCCLGVIPWMLETVSVIPEYRSATFPDSIVDNIDNFVTKIAVIRELKSDEEKNKMIDAVF